MATISKYNVVLSNQREASSVSVWVPAWMDQAACRSRDPEIFFPIVERDPTSAEVRRAKAICATCPVAAECLDLALSTGQTAGIWGGMTPEERRRIRARRLHVVPIEGRAS